MRKKRKRIWIAGILLLGIPAIKSYRIVRLGCGTMLYPLAATVLVVAISLMVLWLLWR